MKLPLLHYLSKEDEIMLHQPGLFDMEERLRQLDSGGDPLVALGRAVDFEMFRPMLATLRDKERKSNAGRPPFDAVLMFKVLVLQSLYNLSDDAMEFQIRDRLSFMRFLGLGLGARVPDAKTIWLFREQLREVELIEMLFARFDAHLAARGFAARKGQIIDASIVAAPRQRNTREENRQIKEERTPAAWEAQPAKRRQKDVDARWVQKNNVNHYGYKNHVNVDVAHKFIRHWSVTDAARHDSQVFTELIDEDNTCADFYADSAYWSEGKLEVLDEWGLRPRIQRKGVRGRPLSKREQQGNRTRSRVRSRVEHVFGIQTQRAGCLIVRTIGIGRARCKIGLRNLAYNLTRFARLAPARA